MDGARRWRSCRPPLLRWLADHDSWASKQATETRRERTRRVAGVVGDVDIVMLFTRLSRTSGAQFESALWQHSPETGSLGSRRTSCVPGRSIGLHRHMAYDGTG